MWPEVARRAEEEKSYLPGVMVCAWLLRWVAGWQGQGILLGYPNYGAIVHICLPKGSYITGWFPVWQCQRQWDHLRGGA